MALTRREFNRELDSYIRGRKRQRIFQTFKSAGMDLDEVEEPKRAPITQSSILKPKTASFSQPTKALPNVVHDDLTPEEKAKFRAMKDKGFPQVQVDEEEEIKSMKNERKKGLFSAFSSMMKGSPSKDETPVLEAKSDSLDPEVEELLKGILTWLDELPVTSQRRFRQSPEYELYRQVIERYGLNKK